MKLKLQLETSAYPPKVYGCIDVFTGFGKTDLPIDIDMPALRGCLSEASSARSRIWK